MPFTLLILFFSVEHFYAYICEGEHFCIEIWLILLISFLLRRALTIVLSRPLIYNIPYKPSIIYSKPVRTISFTFSIHYKYALFPADTMLERRCIDVETTSKRYNDVAATSFRLDLIFLPYSK